MWGLLKKVKSLPQSEAQQAQTDASEKSNQEACAMAKGTAKTTAKKAVKKTAKKAAKKTAKKASGKKASKDVDGRGSANRLYHAAIQRARYYRDKGDITSSEYDVQVAKLKKQYGVK